ncbi:MAG: hypothetical protein PHR15_01220 [Atopobiaceae bacterium]|jgi:hypothetical protein|nr:hypothetical protein [Atopobiaceae bacterium]MCH4181260.1 hypothetical protein [Atopobiaceae bacterium]MCH4214790.1 hypothetical protein [Atopobiaceae bacterium]MCH4276822.1 hypothetical protein [Atopobiaceae bacterium]MCI1226167.1 hypothetical protein [Atopobiaceae bacterium]
MRREGRLSWKAYIRDAVDRTKESETTWAGFVRTLPTAFGVTVTEGRSGVVYHHLLARSDHEMRIKGTTLDFGYGKVGVERTVEVDFDLLLAPTGRPSCPGFTPHGDAEIALRRVIRWATRRTPEEASGHTTIETWLEKQERRTHGSVAHGRSSTR